MEMYTWLCFFSVKYGFDIKILLELLLENLYNETKINTFVYQMAKTEEKEEFSSFYYIVQKIVLNQYMTSKKIRGKVRNCVLIDLFCLTDRHAGMLVLNPGIWSLEFLSAKQNKVKFYNNEWITSKLMKIFNGTFFVQIGPPVFAEFLSYMRERRFLHDKDTNKQVEEILSRYFILYRKKKALLQKNK